MMKKKTKTEREQNHHNYKWEGDYYYKSYRC